MQIRSAEIDETKTVLRRVQKRVLSLATIHRDIYQSENDGRVNVGGLITEIVDQSADLVSGHDGKIDFKKDIEDVHLYPDQAVPLSLLAAEAVANAVKANENPSEAASINVSFKQVGTACALVISNTATQLDVEEGTGLGQRLMAAFALQLEGRIQTEVIDGEFVLSLSFIALDFKPEPRDY